MPGTTYVCRCYDFVVEAVLMGALCVVGFVGNTVSAFRLRADKSKTSTLLLLIALEIADTAFLATVFLLRVLTSVPTAISPSLLFSTKFSYVYICVPMILLNIVVLRS